MFLAYGDSDRTVRPRNTQAVAALEGSVNKNRGGTSAPPRNPSAADTHAVVVPIDHVAYFVMATMIAVTRPRRCGGRSAECCSDQACDEKHLHSGILHPLVGQGELTACLRFAR